MIEHVIHAGTVVLVLSLGAGWWSSRRENDLLLGQINEMEDTTQALRQCAQQCENRAYRYATALAKIVGMETKNSNATVRRMARVAREAL